MTRRAVALPPIEALVPHRDAMLWLTRLVTAENDAVEAEAIVPYDAWYLDEDGGMPGWLGIELMAQALSAHVGLRGWLAGEPPKPGVLLGCRAYRACAACYPAGTALSVKASVVYRDESGFGAYDCTISAGGRELASATLKVYEPTDFAAFLHEKSVP
jgi:predicted hotdog family 3-hydroxylacyl-ACP dehydratase